MFFSAKDSSSGSEYEYKYQLNVNKKKIKKKKFEILKSSSQNTDTGNIFSIQYTSCCRLGKYPWEVVAWGKPLEVVAFC